MKIEGIFKNLELIGYEVLFESSDLPLDGNGAKEKFFENLDEEIDFLIFSEHLKRTEKLKGIRFVNLKPSTLIKYAGKILEMLDGRTVIELREDYASEEEIKEIEKIRKKFPFLLSIDDFGKQASNFDRILLLKPNFVKIEINFFDRKTLWYLANLIRTHKIKLIAEKVETERDFKMIKSFGFDFWQGYFSKKINSFQKPALGGKDDIPF